MDTNLPHVVDVIFHHPDLLPPNLCAACDAVPSGGVGYLGVQLELATSDAFGGSWLLDTHAGSAAPYLNGGVEAGVWMDATLLHGETLSCAALGLHLGVSALGDSGVELKVSRLQNGETCAAGVEIIITVYTDP
eukprot:2663182-Pleurochrysis_carterae.AAC.1